MTDPWTVAGIEALAPDAKSLTAARELLGDDRFPHVEGTADGRGWWAVCEGLTDPYRVEVRPGPSGGFDCRCGCPSRKYPCKHALAFLLYLAGRPGLRETPGRGGRTPADREGLLRAVFADPDDDTPRLVFADYLDENGEPDRAALIRAQCASARLGGDDPRSAALAAELLDRLRPAYDHLPEGFVVGSSRGFFHFDVSVRRFVHAAAAGARVADLFRHGWVEAVYFTDDSDPGYAEREVWFRDEHFSLLRRAGVLDLSAVRLEDSRLVELATEVPAGAAGSRVGRVRVHPDDDGLYRSLLGERAARPRPPAGPREASDERGFHVTDDQLGRLVRAGRLTHVRQLGLSGPVGDAGLAALAAADLRLTTLGLHGVGPVGPAGMAAVASARWAAGLTGLTLIGCKAGDEAVAALAGGGRFAALETLSLTWGEVTEVGAAALLRSGNFPALAAVRLDENPVPVGDRAALVLTAAERPRLEVAFGGPGGGRVVRTAGVAGVRLDLDGAPADVLDGLLRCPELATLTGLGLRDMAVTLGAADRLAAALSPDRWRELDLSGATLGGGLVATLERFCVGHRLTALTLAGLGLKYPDVAQLARSPFLAGVRTLDLSGNPIGIGGLDALLSSPHLAGVDRFRFRGTMSLSQREKSHYQKVFGPRAEF